MNTNHILIENNNKNKNIISFDFSSKLTFNNNLFIKPFGSSRLRYETKNILNINLNLLKKEDNINYYNITITKNQEQLKKSRNAKFFWGNKYDVILELWCPLYYNNINSEIIYSLLPSNYGEIDINNSLVNNPHQKYKFGIIIPFYSRHKYVEKFLSSLKKTNLTNCLLIFIDESLTKDVNEDHKKVNELVKDFNTNYHLIKIYKNKHGNMHDSILYGMDLLYCYCDFLCTIDSDTIHKNNWINDIYISYSKCKEDFSDTNILVSGFNVVNQRHSIVERRENYIIKTSVGGCNMFFSKEIYTNIIRRCLFSHKWDTNIVNSIKDFKNTIITTKQSVIQHIGFETSIKGRINKENYDYAEDYN